MYNKRWLIRKLDITNHKISSYNFIFCTDDGVSVLQLGVPSYNFEHEYITNDDTILLFAVIAFNDDATSLSTTSKNESKISPYIFIVSRYKCTPVWSTAKFK